MKGIDVSETILKRQALPPRPDDALLPRWLGALDLRELRRRLSERTREWAPTRYPSAQAEGDELLLPGGHKLFLVGEHAGWGWDPDAGRWIDPVDMARPPAMPGEGGFTATAKLVGMHYEATMTHWPTPAEPAGVPAAPVSRSAELLPPRPPLLPDGFDLTSEAGKLSLRHGGRDLAAMRRRLAVSVAKWAPVLFPAGILSADGMMWLLGDLSGAAPRADEADACVWIRGPWAGWAYEQRFGRWLALDPLALLGHRAQRGVNGHVLSEDDIWSMAQANAT